MTLRVYNTLTRTKEDFQPIDPSRVTMYLCGPTVYKPAHIGHMVGPVIFDTIKRYLVYSGYNVEWVVNITDIDDKLINKANELGKSVDALAEEMTADYLENLRLMQVTTIDKFPKATDHIENMLEMIGRLVDQGHAYPLEGDVYFAVKSDDDYGKLSRRSIDAMMAGTRVEANDRKRHPADFALWKKSRDGEPSWDSPWGPGRPGWHIECSAMSTKLLGETIDIHGGGLDLMFPHHENELAQSESCSGKPFSKYWLHNGLMQESGQKGKVGGGHDRTGDSPEEQLAGKMSGSLGAKPIKEAVFPHHAPETVRFFLLGTHYRSPIDFSLERISEVEKGLDGFYRLFEEFERATGQSFYTLRAPTTRNETVTLTGDAEFFAELTDFRARFWESMDDDFNTGGAVGVLFELRKSINGLINRHGLDKGQSASDEVRESLVAAVTLLKELASTLGVFQESVQKAGGGADDEFAGQLMELLIQLRADARKSKNFAVADGIRDGLTALGVTLEDRTGETIWRRD